VKGDRAQIATELSGIIVEVPVKENQAVSRGQLLFKLDDQSYRLALIRLEAEIETARAEIRGLRAQWRVKREEIKAALSQRPARRPSARPRRRSPRPGADVAPARRQEDPICTRRAGR
jgi:membrane fusion protein (multidrug efflux system)